VCQNTLKELRRERTKAFIDFNKGTKGARRKRLADASAGNCKVGAVFSAE